MPTARTIACRMLATSAALATTLAVGATAHGQAVAPQEPATSAQAQGAAPQEPATSAQAQGAAPREPATSAQAQAAAPGGPATRAQAPLKVAKGCDAAIATLQRKLRDLRYAVGRADGCDGPATRAAVQAFQKAQGLVADGVAGPLTRRALRSPVRPVARVRGAGRHVEVDLAKQLLLIVRDGRVERIYAATTGMAGHETPRGTYRVVRKETRSWSGEYNVWMPWASYFDGARGLAIHAGDVRPAPASHGCVRVPTVFAEQVFRALPMSAKVVVR